VLKGGCDAHNTIIVDITWADATSKPVVKWELVETRRWKADEELLERTKKHMTLVWKLEHAVLRDLSEAKYEEPLSSAGTRRKQVTMGTMITTAVRKALSVDMVMLNAGGIRGNKDYEETKLAFTFGDLKTEVPFESEIAILQLPGKVVRDAIQYSRRLWNERDYSGFLQLDSTVKVEMIDEDHMVTEIAGAPIDLEKDYTVAAFHTTLKGMDNIVPLTEYLEGQPERIPPEDAAIPAKVILADYYHKEIWSSLGDLANIDTNHDGVIDKDEIAVALRNKFGMEVTEETVEEMMKAMDADGDGVLKVDEVKEGQGAFGGPSGP